MSIIVVVANTIVKLAIVTVVGLFLLSANGIILLLIGVATLVWSFGKLFVRGKRVDALGAGCISFLLMGFGIFLLEIWNVNGGAVEFFINWAKASFQWVFPHAG